MSLTLDWQDIALRLALTIAAGVLFGINRTERGRSAGLRTTLLVSLAASVSMIQTNLLLAMAGKRTDSFITLDLMRLPLGILTGMGFIGAGAILRRGERIQGVTTASTLWFVTVVGLCFGGGQHFLGLAAAGIGLVVLWWLKWLELRLQEDSHATLLLRVTVEGPTREEIQGTLQAAGYATAAWSVAYTNRAHRRQHTMRCEVRWHGQRKDVEPPTLLDQFAQHPGVLELRWTTHGESGHAPENSRRPPSNDTPTG